MSDPLHPVRYWILDGHTPVPVPDSLTWGRWFETAARQVALTMITPEVSISTVFLGWDPCCRGDGAPRLFESMAFGLPEDWDEIGERYETWEQATHGHEAVCVAVDLRLRETGMAIPEGFAQERDPATWRRSDQEGDPHASSL